MNEMNCGEKKSFNFRGTQDAVTCAACVKEAGAQAINNAVKSPTGRTEQIDQ